MAIFLCNLGHSIMRDPVIKLRLHFCCRHWFKSVYNSLGVLDIISDHSTLNYIYAIA